MNHRILELALQAENYAAEQNDKFGVSYKKEYNKKFAELIVRECLGKIENEAAQYHEPTWAFELTQDIKEHFGVEQ